MSDITWDETDEAPGEQAIAFAITVDGRPAARATLGLDIAGLPVERLQAVEFESGEMTVVERYLDVAIDGPVEAESFALPAAE